jgi:adenylate cyclase
VFQLLAVWLAAVALADGTFGIECAFFQVAENDFGAVQHCLGHAGQTVGRNYVTTPGFPEAICGDSIRSLMMSPSPTQAWLEGLDSGPIPVSGNLSFGRVAGNKVVLPDERVSRRHAVIHAQGEGEFWLVDLGSRNGTYLNDRRVQHPVRLQEGDRLRVGGSSFTFHQPGAECSAMTTAGSTVQSLEVRPIHCWLLVADVAGSTQLARKAAPDEVAMLMGQWFLQCKQLIEAAGGTMNKYLGDGFLAFWHAEAISVEAIAKCVEELQKLQQSGQPPFRFVLHRGQVFLGGAASLGEESLSGPEVIFVFRMEKLAGALGERCLLSEAARLAWESEPITKPLGRHSLPGFEGNFLFHSL